MMPEGQEPRRAGLGNRLIPARFLVFLAVLPLGFVVYRAAWPGTGWQSALVAAFDIAALCFLLLLIPLFRDNTAAAIRRHARANDAGRGLVLALTTLVTLAVLAAIGGELDPARRGVPWAMALLIGTLVLAWLFTNTLYALHYAHMYYTAAPQGDGDQGGLDFPGSAPPGYADFAYFAFTLGMTFQTSDVAVTSPAIRRVVLVHSLVAFVFNIGVIAFTINALG